MSSSSFEQELLGEFSKLAPVQQQQVLDYVRTLRTSKPKGVPGSTLFQFAGTIDAQDLQLMAQAIEEGCEQVDSHEW
jgi:hypothetical protein